MSTSNIALIILPLLVSGFLFTLIFYPTRFISAKFDGQRLFFFAATIGIFFGLVTALVYPIIDSLIDAIWPLSYGPLGLRAQKIFPVDYPGALISCVALSLVFALALNGLLCISWNKNKWHRVVVRSGWNWTINFLIRKIGDPLQQLLIRAVTEQKKVVVSLKSGRVYIGFVYRVPPRPHVDTSYIEVLTEYSLFRTTLGRFPKRDQWSVYPGAKLTELKGYMGTLNDSIRNIKALEDAAAQTKTKLVTMLEKKLGTVRETLAKLEDEIGVLPKEDWIRVIPTAEIESISYFDERIFVWFRENAPEIEEATVPSSKA
ncbi:hypothetical protein [Lysobacter antibioticus]|uniref:hypothetical protein n=1 Tax=Lysobacter antibioticus TaxID=84531 RepID=UPI000A7317AC|nr:hypothetical protein [Lysobacter antibioticus]